MAATPPPRQGVSGASSGLTAPARFSCRTWGVDLRRLHIGVPEQLLHHPDVGARLQQAGREGVAQGMGSDPLVDPGLAEFPGVPRPVEHDEADDPLRLGALRFQAVVVVAQHLANLIHQPH